MNDRERKPKTGSVVSCNLFLFVLGTVAAMSAYHRFGNTSIVDVRLDGNADTSSRKKCPHEWVHDPQLLGVSNRTRLTFIHIPKTGGTSIENALEQLNISVGKKRWRAKKHPYSVTKNSVGCSLWHRPPVSPVDNSFTIVREPAERLESEFKFRRLYDQDTKKYPLSPDGFEAWAKVVIAAAQMNPNLGDCHFIPQYNFARFATLIIPYHCYKVFTQKLPGYYGLEVNLPEVYEKNATIHGGWVANISPELISLIRKFYAVDYAYLGHLFNYS
jgi:hypothetical protein